MSPPRLCRSPPRRNVPPAKPAPSPTITVTITGDGRGIGKTQLAELLQRKLSSWSPKGIERPQVVVVDAEQHATTTDTKAQVFHPGGFVGGPMAALNEVPAMAVPPKLTSDALAGKPGHADVTVVPGYAGLLGVLMEALNQAQYGKGADRHNLGGDIPFERQRMQQISELIGSPDGMVYQACKKITEGVALPTLDRQVAELLGAVNYICGIVIFLRKRADGDGVVSRKTIAESIATPLPEDVCQDEGCAHRPSECEALLKPYVDPVHRNYPKTPATGWVADCVNDLFGTLSALARELDDNPAGQRLARVWRVNSPILKAIDRHRDLIDNTIQSPDIDPATAPWADSNIDPNEAAENHLRKLGIPT